MKSSNQYPTGALCDLSTSAQKAPTHPEVTKKTRRGEVYAEDVSDEYLEAMQANGWPRAEWVWFPAANHRVAYIGWMFAGEEVLEQVPRWRVMDLVRSAKR